LETQFQPGRTMQDSIELCSSLPASPAVSGRIGAIQFYVLEQTHGFILFSEKRGEQYLLRL